MNIGFETFKQQLKKSLFSIEELRLFFESGNHTGKNGFYASHLSYWVKSGKVTKVINGWYRFADHPLSQIDRFHIANSIYQPSYISLETAFSFYGIIPETVRITTSISTKRTQEYATAYGVYLYQTMKVGLFFGYELISSNSQDVMIAQIEKCLFDYCYLHTDINNVIDFEMLRRNKEILISSVNCDLLRRRSLLTNKGCQKRISLLISFINA